MLLRYWTWTSGPAPAAAAGVPVGPLRFRGWTSAPAGAAISGLSFGPLRFRAWTSGAAVTPVDPAEDPRYGTPVRPGRIAPVKWRRARRHDDDEILILLS